MPTFNAFVISIPRSLLTSTGTGNEGGNFASSSGRSSGNHSQLLSWPSVFQFQSQSSIKACQAADINTLNCRYLYVMLSLGTQINKGRIKYTA